MKELKNTLGWFFRQTRGYHSAFWGICLTGILRICAQLGFVWILKRLVDIATGRSDSSLYLSIGLMVIILLCQLSFSALTYRQREIIRVKLGNHLRSVLFSSVMRSQWMGREKLHTGDTMNRLEEDVRVVGQLYCDQLPAIVMVGFQLLAASAFLYVLQPALLLILLFIMPVALVMSKLFFKITRRITGQIRQNDSEVQSHVQEHLQNRTLVLTMGQTELIENQLDTLQGEGLNLNLKRLSFNVRSRFFVQLGFMTGYSVAFIWGILGLMEGTVTYGMLTAFLQLVNQIQRPIVDLSQYLPHLIQSYTSIERLKELAVLPQEEQAEEHRLSGPVGIRIENLTYSYPDAENATLQQLSYDFEPCTSTAIVGETGAGKSTLMRLMLALLKPDAGSITLYDKEVSLPASVSTRCNFMYVPQGNSLISGTVRENLLLGNPEATDEEMTQALHLAAADFILERAEGLDTPCSEKGAGLSEGQAQRIAIARALLQPGNILVLDEASSALDEETERQILHNLSQQSTLDRKTIIWITHHAQVSQYMERCLQL